MGFRLAVRLSARGVAYRFLCAVGADAATRDRACAAMLASFDVWIAAGLPYRRLYISTQHVAHHILRPARWWFDPICS